VENPSNSARPLTFGHEPMFKALQHHAAQTHMILAAVTVTYGSPRTGSITAEGESLVLEIPTELGSAILRFDPVPA
jgi:hypothetical protein